MATVIAKGKELKEVTCHVCGIKKNMFLSACTIVVEEEQTCNICHDVLLSFLPMTHRTIDFGELDAK
jgi:cytochrome c5